MKGLSDEIKIALDTIILGLEHKFEVDDLEPEKMKKIMDSKVSSFNSAKKILDRWINSPNAPTKETVKTYVTNLIKAGEKAIKTLRETLKQEIDFELLPADKHDSAIKAKPLILEAILDLSSNIYELQQKLDTDTISLAEVEFKLGYPERFAKGELFNTKEYFKEPVRNDKVYICPFGTEGKEIVLTDLKIVLPQPPKDKSKILFSDLPKKEQYWRRPEIPEISPDNVEFFDDIIREEFRRRTEGVWFMNNGEPVYLTGHHYFHMTYFRMMDDGDFPKFRYAQLHMFYHLQACIVDPRCLGQLFGKSRRTGFTYCVLAILLNQATYVRNGKFGLMSKTGTDGEEAFLKLSYAFQSLPFWFRPIVQGKIDSTSHLYFSAPADNSKTAKKEKRGNINDYLNTMIDWRNTTNGSYDSIKLNGYLLDECFDPSTLILTEDGFKKIRDIKEGDYVINSKGHKKKVISTVVGVSDMFTVHQPYAKDYVVTGNHKMYVNYGSDQKNSKNVFMSPIEYFELPEHRRRYVRSVYSERFEYEEQDLPIPPYLLGLWLGDGDSSNTSIATCNTDLEIINYLEEYAKEEGLKTSYYQNSENCITIRFVDKNSIGANQYSRPKHKLKNKLRELNVLNNKHIPEIYLKSSVKQRLELLAGLLDSDGYLKDTKSNGFVVKMSRKHMIEEIYKLTKELGLSTSNITTYKSNFDTDVYSVSFTDYDAEIPTKLPRKKSTKTKKVNRRNRMWVTYKGVGEYKGITLEGDNDEDKLLVLEDYTVSKNCFKFEKPNDIVTHLGMITPTMMPNNGTPVGKMFAGSTMGAHSKGGAQGIELINNSNVLERDQVTQKTTTGLYFHFLPAQDNMEDFTDIYGFCHVEKPKSKTLNVKGLEIKTGSMEFLLATEEQKKKQSDVALNEQLRTYPRTVEHMMRDESSECVFNMNKLNDQIEFNNTLTEDQLYTKGNFEWVDGEDGDVAFFPNPQGRFKVSWLPSKVDGTEHLANRVKEINDKFFPLNKDVVRFGCDPFSAKSTHGEGSKGGIHGKTLMFPEGGAPSNKFVVEYIARPTDETIFFEDVIKVIRYYGAPILVESNRLDLLRHMRNRGYRAFAMDRLDRTPQQLNPNEKEYGGQVMSGKDMLDSHMNSIGSWIEKYVGKSTNEEFRPLDEIGDMPFSETLRDWLHFNPDARTKYDATISSGLAIMACSTEKYRKKKTTERKKSLNLYKKYNNSGVMSKKL